MRNIFLLLLAAVLLGCSDQTFQPLDELSPNPLAPGGPVLFTATDINLIPRGGFIRDVEFNYSHIHSELPETLRNTVTAVRVQTPMRTITLDLERSLLFEQNYNINDAPCYVFWFVGGVNQEVLSRETEICFTIN